MYGVEISSEVLSSEFKQMVLFVDVAVMAGWYKSALIGEGGGGGGVMARRAWKRGVAGTLCIRSIYSHVLPYVKEYERNAERMLPVVRE